MGCDKEKAAAEGGRWAQEGAYGEDRVLHNPYAVITSDAVSDRSEGMINVPGVGFPVLPKMKG